MSALKIMNAILFLTVVSGCSKEEVFTVAGLLQNEKGWYSYEFKRVDIGKEEAFQARQPYIIIGEYGSGFKITEDRVCHINYSDGSEPIREGTVTRTWELISDSVIIFTSQFTDSRISASILELSPDHLWIQYEHSGDRWEYKLKRIE